MARSRLLIAAIHNGELADSPAQQVIDELSDQAATIIEIQDQAPFQPRPDKVGLKQWRSNQAELETRWARYLERPTTSIKTMTGRALFDLRLELDGSFRRQAWLVRQVEHAVTAKHIEAWRQFHRSGLDELLVLESDAVRTDRSRDAVEQLLGTPSDIARYVNLAGGLDPHKIDIAHLADDEHGRIPGLRRYRKPVTNTSCTYLINAPFAALATRHLDARPEDASLGIDWLVNAIFLAQDETKTSVECLHAEPPAIIHGSTEGVTRSWHPNR